MIQHKSLSFKLPGWSKGGKRLRIPVIYGGPWHLLWPHCTLETLREFHTQMSLSDFRKYNPNPPSGTGESEGAYASPPVLTYGPYIDL